MLCLVARPSALLNQGDPLWVSLSGTLPHSPWVKIGCGGIGVLSSPEIPRVAFWSQLLSGGLLSLLFAPPVRNLCCPYPFGSGLTPAT